MTLIKKRDVKDYFAARRLQGNRARILPTTQTEAAGVPEKAPVVVETPQAAFSKDFTADHSAARKPKSAAVDSSAPVGSQDSPVSRKVRK